MGKHEKLLKKILQKPKPANILWSDVEKMLIYYGAKIKEGKGSAISVVLNKNIAVFHRPHPGNKADRGALNNVIKLLQRCQII